MECLLAKKSESTFIFDRWISYSQYVWASAWSSLRVLDTGMEVMEDTEVMEGMAVTVRNV